MTDPDALVLVYIDITSGVEAKVAKTGVINPLNPDRINLNIKTSSSK